MRNLNLLRPLCRYCKSGGVYLSYEGAEWCHICKGTGRVFYKAPREWLRRWWKVIW